MVAATGCDGVVVGRGCLGRPWLFRDLADAFAGRPLADPPDLGEVARIMHAHASFLRETFGDEHGIRQFRKHTSWYLTGFPVGPDDLARILERLDGAVPFPPGASR